MYIYSIKICTIKIITLQTKQQTKYENNTVSARKKQEKKTTRTKTEQTQEENLKLSKTTNSKEVNKKHQKLNKLSLDDANYNSTFNSQLNNLQKNADIKILQIANILM